MFSPSFLCVYKKENKVGEDSTGYDTFKQAWYSLNSSPHTLSCCCFELLLFRNTSLNQELKQLS